METGLEGKVALVCAASRGLGKAAARGLAAEGAKVAMCARHMPTLEAAAAEIQAETGTDVLAIGADVARRSDITRLVDQTVQHFGRLDVLVTNSGGPKAGLFGATTESDWRDAIDLVLMSTVLLCMEAVPHMRRQGGGRIINITSISAKQPIAGLMLSNALRPAVTGFSKTLANELARDGILVNCVAPGYTRTERVVELAEATAAREGRHGRRWWRSGPFRTSRSAGWRSRRSWPTSSSSWRRTAAATSPARRFPLTAAISAA